MENEMIQILVKLRFLYEKLYIFLYVIYKLVWTSTRIKTSQ